MKNKSHFLTQGIFLLFFSRIFMALAFTFRSIIYFKLMFVYDVR